MAAIWEKFIQHTEPNIGEKTELKKENDDQKYAIGSEEDAGLFKGAAVAEDGDDQDEGADRN